MFGAAPLPEPAEVDRRIATAAAARAAHPPGTAEHRAARVEQAKWLFARYTAAGDDADRAAAAATCHDVLTDPAATPAERQAVGMIQPVLTMLALFRPGAAPVPPPEHLAGRMREVAAQADAVPGAAELPPDVRGVLGAVGGFARVVEDAQRPGWDGRIAPEHAARLADLPADLPGREAVTALLAWLGGPVDPQDRATGLRAALADLPGDHLLAPVLRLDLARAVAGDPATADRPALAEAAALLERARDGLAADDTFRGEAERSLAGVLLATAAHTPTAAAVERVERAVADILRRPTGDGPADRGASVLLGALAAVLRATADGTHVPAGVTGQVAEAIALLPGDHPLRPVAVGQGAALLSDRFLREGRFADGTAAALVADELVRAASVHADGSVAFLRCVAGLCGVTRAGRLGDADALTDAAAALRAGLAELPGHDLLRPVFALVAALAELQLAAVSGDRARLWTAAQATRLVLDTGTLPGVGAAALSALAGTLDAVRGALAGDSRVVTAAIARMEAGLDADGDDAVLFVHERVARRALLGQALLAAHELGVDGAAARAVAHLSTALRLLGDRRPGVQRHEILRGLARAHRAAGDRAAAREAAFAALEALAGVVLLQSAAGDAVRSARGASADAATLAHWCLADGDPARAAQAMELGRALALHAAVSTTRVPDLLRDAGHAGLAQEWAAAAAATGPAGWADALSAGLGASGDLRQRVLDTLRVTPAGARLFAAPALDDVGRALAEVGADTLVHLVPGDGTADGHLVLVDRDGAARAVPAPGLRVEPDGPVARLTPLLTAGTSPLRNSVLLEVAQWAGAAVVAPLLTALDRGEPPRVVLVPAGVLGAVPWAAALLPGPGPARPACTELVISTAASARQLVDVAGRSSAPTGAVVLVGDPTGSLPGATREVAGLRDALFPEAVVLDGAAATPEAVLDRLPGAALVHLACHAAAAGSPDESRLELTAPLTVRRVLDRALWRAAGGATVVLSSCGSDVTDRDHDEALSLATAFLAAGAVSVVGSRWPVLDRSADVVAFALHHFHATGLPMAEALRRTQLWLLDRDREPLPGMPERMRSRSAVLADMAVWAAFSHQGR